MKKVYMDVHRALNWCAIFNSSGDSKIMIVIIHAIIIDSVCLAPYGFYGANG